MADIALANSTYSSGTNDTASTLINNVTATDAQQWNGVATAVVGIETILGTGTTLKGNKADLVARLAVNMDADGVLTAASTTTAGVVEIATQAEVEAMTDTTRVVTSNHNKLVMSTMASLSGTSLDFTGIPAGVRRITGMINGMSTNGTSNYMVQIGDSGGVETSGYAGSASTGTTDGLLTTGFALAASTAATSIANGAFTLTLMDSATNLWVCTSILGYSNAAGTSYGAGSKALTATLDRVRITTVGGTNTFDAGSINLMYER